MCKTEANHSGGRGGGGGGRRRDGGRGKGRLGVGNGRIAICNVEFHQNRTPTPPKALYKVGFIFFLVSIFLNKENGGLE